MRIFLVGGASGGHFYPLLAIAEQLWSKPGATQGGLELYYIGPHPYDQPALDAQQITFLRCPAGKRRKYASWLNVWDMVKTLWGTLWAIILLYRYYPDVVMSKGGFTSVPVILAAAFLRIPIVVHESDATPGTANKIAARFARYIAISYEDTAAHFPPEKVALTGIPLRARVLQPPARPHDLLQIDDSLPVLFITGGSQGATRINDLVLESLDELLPYFTIVHQVGRANVEETLTITDTLIRDETLKSRYHIHGALSAEQMAAAYAVASIVVTRAGSTALAEIAAAGKPSIVIPIPETISHDQRKNAYAFAASGAASVLEEGNLTDAIFTAEITRIMGDETVRQKMAAAAGSFAKTGAAPIIADALIEIGNEHV